ncbi:MAG: winged helix-turn-helix transcriptional regulator [Bacteroidota bacterium]
MIVDGKAMAYTIDGELFHCGTNVTLHFIGGKWKSIILWYLRKGPKRFSELKRLMPDITEKMLSIQLKALQEDRLIERQVFGIKPPNRVEYSLSDFGVTFIPVIQKITEWGIQYAERNGQLIATEE